MGEEPHKWSIVVLVNDLALFKCLRGLTSCSQCPLVLNGSEICMSSLGQCLPARCDGGPHSGGPAE